MYHYKGHIERIIDGDTLVVNVDVGFRMVQTMVFRLYGVNTPEIVGENRAKGLEAKNFVIELLPVGKEVEIKTYKDKQEKYGRYLAEVWFVPEEGEQRGDLATQLIAAGLAVPME